MKRLYYKKYIRKGELITDIIATTNPRIFNGSLRGWKYSLKNKIMDREEIPQWSGISIKNHISDMSNPKGYGTYSYSLCIHNKLWREGDDFESKGGRACQECVEKTDKIVD